MITRCHEQLRGKVQWAKIAALTLPVSKNPERMQRHVDDIVESLRQIPRGSWPSWTGHVERSAADRISALRDVDRRSPVDQFELYIMAQISSLAYQALEIHRLATTNDPDLDRRRAQAEDRAAKVLGQMNQTFAQIEEALQETRSGNLKSWNPIRNYRNLHLVLDAELRRLEQSTKSLSEAGAAAASFLTADGRLSLPIATTKV